MCEACNVPVAESSVGACYARTMAFARSPEGTSTHTEIFMRKVYTRMCLAVVLSENSFNDEGNAVFSVARRHLVGDLHD